MMDRRDRNHFAGCLLGGAVGDALGAPVEFLSLSAIRRQYGARGIQEPPQPATITDDTQMTLFTAEAVLRESTRNNSKCGFTDFATMAHHAYLRWLRTQGERADCTCFERVTRDTDNGWLIRVKELYARRAPGTTCLCALRSGRMGTVASPLSRSKGCGGVVRVAPVGLFWSEPDVAFERGCEAAAVTHGHPSGYLPAGCLAAIISAIIGGGSLSQAVEITVVLLRNKPGHEECLAALSKAQKLATRRAPAPETISELGEGWTATEALAVAVYCVLSAPCDFAAAVRLAVNHSGDSDSTGAITGNILGAFLGREAIPAGWLQCLELRGVLEQVAADLLTGYRDDPQWSRRYPPF